MEIYGIGTQHKCMCGVCLCELDKKIVQMNIPNSDNNNLYIGDLKRKDQEVIFKKTIKCLKEIDKSSFFTFPDAEQRVFFSSEGIFIRKIILMLDDYFERSELHQLLKNCLASAYLIRMENHYRRVNAHRTNFLFKRRIQYKWRWRDLIRRRLWEK